MTAQLSRSAIHSTVRRLGLITLAGVALCGNSCSPTAQQVFQALRDCSANQITPSDSIVYFGPTNAPIGTIYQVEGTGYDPYYPGTKITGDPPSAAMVIPPAYGQCTVKGNSSFDFSSTITASVTAIPASGDLSNDFKNAKVLNMTANQVGWELLYKLPYQQALTADSVVYSQIAAKDGVVASVALLKVKGYSATLQLTSGDTAGLHAKYTNGPVSKALTGSLTAAVDLKWTNDNTLTISIADETTLGGVLRKINKGSIAAGSATPDFFGQSIGSDGALVILNAKH